MFDIDVEELLQNVPVVTINTYIKRDYNIAVRTPLHVKYDVYLKLYYIQEIDNAVFRDMKSLVEFVETVVGNIESYKSYNKDYGGKAPLTTWSKYE